MLPGNTLSWCKRGFSNEAPHCRRRRYHGGGRAGATRAHPRNVEVAGGRKCLFLNFLQFYDIMRRHKLQFIGQLNVILLLPVFLQQSATLTVSQRSVELWSHIYLLCFYCVTLALYTVDYCNAQSALYCMIGHWHYEPF